MTLRSLARGSLLVTAANIVPRAATFLLLPIYTRFLSQADFGLVSLAGSAALLLAVACRLGLDASLLRWHSDLEGADRRELYATIALLCLASVGVAVLIGALALAVIGPSIEPETLPVVLLALAIGATNAFQFVPSVWYRATDRTGTYLALAIGSFLAMAATTLALVVVVELGAIGSLLGQLAGATVLAAAAAAILMRQRPWRFRRDLARVSLDFGVPLLPHSLAMWLLNVSDRWLLGILLGLAAAPALAAIGVYSLGYQLGYAIALVAVSVNAAWLPFVYRVGNGPAGPGIVREATTIFVAGYFTLAAAVAILAPDLVALVAPPDWAEAADITVIVAFASAVNATGLMLASGIYLVRDTRRMPLLTAIAAAVNVGLNVLLIPRAGIIGAAWATLAAYTVLAVLTWMLARRRYPLRIDGPRLVAAVSVALGLTLVSRVLGSERSLAAVMVHLVLVALAAGAAWALVRAPIARLRLSMPAAGAIDPGPTGAPEALG